MYFGEPNLGEPHLGEPKLGEPKSSPKSREPVNHGSPVTHAPNILAIVYGSKSLRLIFLDIEKLRKF